MNLGLIIPVNQENQEQGVIRGIFKAMSSLIADTPDIGIKRIEIAEDVNLVVCSVLFHTPQKMDSDFTRKKLKQKLAKIFEEENIFIVAEHPDIKQFYCEYDNPEIQKKEEFVKSQAFHIDKLFPEIVSDRFLELLKLVNGVGDIKSREVTVTGSPEYLEYAISGLITRVKLVNILLPEENQSLYEAEKAFVETGIPVHITNDHEVLDRSALWIRFPFDHISFDVLPEIFSGIIIDIGDMKIIDTKNRKIFNIILEFSDRMKRKIGHNILCSFEEGVLEDILITSCRNEWKTTSAEASLRLGMKLSFKS